MKGMLLSFSISFVRRLLSNIFITTGKNLWDATWSEIFTAVEMAEKRWKESGKGEKKKEWVINTVLEYIESQTSLYWFQKRIIRFFISSVADAIIETLNEEVGQSWVKKVESLERELAHKIPFF